MNRMKCNKIIIGSVKAERFVITADWDNPTVVDFQIAPP